MFVCLSPGGQSVTVGEASKNNLLVGTVNGIFSFSLHKIAVICRHTANLNEKSRHV